MLDANLMLMVPLFTGGRLGAASGAAARLVVASEYDVREAQAEAALDAEDAYLRAILAAEVQLAESLRVEATAELVRVSQLQFEAGKGIEANVRRSEAELAQAHRVLARAAGEGEKALLDLKVALGIDLDSRVTLADSFPEPREIQPLDFYTSAAATNRASLLAVRARFQAAEQNVRSAAGSLKPQLYGIAMADAGTQRMASGSSLGFVLSIPLFDGGERRAETARMRAMQARTEAEIREAELSAQREVRRAYIDRTTAQVNVLSAETSVRAAASAYEVVALRVANGKGILIEQLDALQAVTKARADLSEARYERAIADARLRRSAGLAADQETRG